MGRRTIAALGIVATLAGPSMAARARRQAEELLQVVTPTAGEIANAHPFVNVIVSFGHDAKTGAAADPATFRARIGREDVTDAFEPISDGTQQTGARASLPAQLVKIGRRPRNRLRLTVRATRDPQAKGPALRDVDRVKFGAQEAQNQPPIAMITASTGVLVVGVPVNFDAAGSHDPDLDPLTYAWDFGDGATSSGPTATHVFAGDATGDIVVTLRASDGQAATPAVLTLLGVPGVDEGKTPGILHVEAVGPLEFGAIAVGTTAARTLTLHNLDATPTSQLKVRLAPGDAATFAISPPSQLVLGPDETSTVDVTFTPATGGHHDSPITLVASASNRASVSFLAHGYGGNAPGSGPTLVAVPVYSAFPDLRGLMPDGRTVVIDASVGECEPSTRDVCLVSGDCGTSAETCAASTTAYPTAELCSDGQSLFLLSDEGTFTEPNPNADTERAVTLMRIDLDAAGNATGKEILDRTTTETEHVACDGLPASQGGLAYLAEFHNVADTDTCFRDERNALVRVNKSTGNTQVVSGYSRLDAIPGVGECDDRDPVQQLAVTADGTRMVAGFETSGLWRIRPTALFLTPDVSDGFQLHPDGSVVVARARDSGTTGIIDLYRVTDQQVEHGAVALAALTPCASIAVPNNASGDAVGRTSIVSLVVGPASLVSRDGTALASFVSGITPVPPDVLPFGNVRGIAAFSLPPDVSSCAAVGVIGLEAPQLAR